MLSLGLIIIIGVICFFDIFSPISPIGYLTLPKHLSRVFGYNINTLDVAPFTSDHTSECFAIGKSKRRVDLLCGTININY
jgi:hypothetical protein